MARGNSFMVPNCRFAFTDSLFKPRAMQNGAEKWGCTLLIPKKDAVIGTIRKAVMECAVASFGEKIRSQVEDPNSPFKHPLLDGDGKQGRSRETGEPHAGFAGHWFIRPSANIDRKPDLLDRYSELITTKDQLFSGCYGRAVVAAWSWEHPTNGKGVSFNLNGIQVLKEGEHLGGAKVDSRQWLTPVEDDEFGEVGDDFIMDEPPFEPDSRQRGRRMFS